MSKGSNRRKFDKELNENYLNNKFWDKQKKGKKTDENKKAAS